MVKNLRASVGDTGDAGLIPGSGRFPGEGSSDALQYSCLGNPQADEPGGVQSMRS